MNFEDELRATMRGHDAEAPRVADLPPRPWQRRRPPTWLLAAAAAVVVAAVAVPVAVLSGSGGARPSAAGPSHHTSTSVAATAQDLAPCPTKYRGSGTKAWVPALPSSTNGAARLVPQAPPTAAVVCAYLHRRGNGTTGGKLTGHKQLSSGLYALSGQLSWLPRHLAGQSSGCLAYIASTDFDAYLLELQYPTGRVWVAVDGDHCSGASNGQFATGTNLRVESATAYASGRWPAPSRPSCARPESAGRLGDDKQLVPPTPSSVTICSGDGKQLLAAADPAGLVAALDRLPTATGGLVTCSSSAPASYGLLFHYPTGPDQYVAVLPGCSEGVLSALQSKDASTVVAEIHRLLGKR